MGLVGLEEAKSYLRVDSSYEDALIQSLLESAEATCMDVARLRKTEWDALMAQTGDVIIRGEERTRDEVWGWPAVLRGAVLFTLGYLYEHREEADHHDLILTLRSLLTDVREGVL